MSETAVTTDTVPAGTSSSSEGSPAVGVIPGRRLLVLILILVNSGAIVGQSGWFLEHVTSKFSTYLVIGSVSLVLPLAVTLAAGLEMVGAFLSQMADALDARGLPSGGIRAGSYGIGLLIGALNFSHWWSFGWQASASFAFFSTISPFLWGIYARVRRGVHTAPSRRLWHPFRSFRLIRFMAWEGIADEDQGVIALEVSQMASDDNAPTSGAPTGNPTETGRIALQMKAEDPDRSWESIAEQLGITDRHLRTCRKAAEKAGVIAQ